MHRIYTVGMPGFLLESDETPLDGNYAIIEYDPIRLNQTYPNIDVRASRTDRRGSGEPGLVDTVWVNALLEEDDGNFYARQFTLTHRLLAKFDFIRQRVIHSVEPNLLGQNIGRRKT